MQSQDSCYGCNDDDLTGDNSPCANFNLSKLFNPGLNYYEIEPGKEDDFPIAEIGVSFHVFQNDSGKNNFTQEGDRHLELFDTAISRLNEYFF